MKAYDNGSMFTVSYNPSDCAAFSRTWPCSTVQGRGAFVFDKNGDLVELEGSAQRAEGSSDWVAFAEDCKVYGRVRLSGATPNKAQEAVWNHRQA